MTLRFALAVLLIIAGFVGLLRVTQAQRDLDAATAVAFSQAGAPGYVRNFAETPS